MKTPRKGKTRAEIKTFCEGCGLTNVNLYYSKSEGWWIESDQFDNWVSMDSNGVILALKRLFNKK